MILVLSFLFKGESFSFLRGLWLLDLDNRKTFLVDIFWISFASGVLRRRLESLLLPSIGEIFVRSIYFFGKHCLVYGRAASTWVFLQGFLNSLAIGCVLYQGVSISINAIYDFILLFFCSFCFFLMMQQI